MTLLGVVDPGLMCGLVWVDCGEGTITGGDAHAYTTLRNVDDILRREIRNLHGEIGIICERYTITQQTAKMSPQHDALEVIGTLRYLCRIHDVKFELQSRADRLRVSHATLKKIGWWIPTPGGHTNEAARHALVAFTKRWPNHNTTKLAIDTIS